MVSSSPGLMSRMATYKICPRTIRDTRFGSNAWFTYPRPVRIECEQVSKLAQFGTPLRFAPADPFARVFEHLPACWNELRSVDSPPVYRGTRELQLKTGVFRVDLGSPVSLPLQSGTLFQHRLNYR